MGRLVAAFRQLFAKSPELGLLIVVVALGMGGFGIYELTSLIGSPEGVSTAPAGTDAGSTTDAVDPSSDEGIARAAINEFLTAQQPWISFVVDPNNARAGIVRNTQQGLRIPDSIMWVCPSTVDIQDASIVVQGLRTGGSQPLRPAYTSWLVQNRLAGMQTIQATDAFGRPETLSCVFVAQEATTNSHVAYTPGVYAPLKVFVGSYAVSAITTMNRYEQVTADFGKVQGYYVEFKAAASPYWTGMSLTPSLSGTARFYVRPDNNKVQMIDHTLDKPSLSVP